MGLFRKRQKQDLEIKPLKHIHTYKDFPWYMQEKYDSDEKYAEYFIIEPYVCVTCGRRENKILEHERWNKISNTFREQLYAEIRKKYKEYLKPQAVVEDMINNVLLVKDPDYLNMVEIMYGLPHRGCGTSANMSRENNELSINLKENKK